MKIEGRTMVFKAIKLANGKHVCVDVDSLGATTKIVANQREYEIAVGQGWCDSPQEAMARLETEEQAIGQAAAERAHDDLKMSPAAQAEIAVVEAEAGIAHVVNVPEGPKRRGRKRE